MYKKIIPIRGMHCKSCEILIKEKLEALKSVKSAKVSFKEKSAVITYEGTLDMGLLADAITDAGYEIGEDKPKFWISKNLKDYTDLGITMLVMVVLFYIGSSLGLFNISIGGGNLSNLFIVLLIGLTAGLSTCMALIGGLVLGISARHAEKHPEAKPLEKFRPHLYFNLGRIISYFIFGGIAGLLGKAFQLSSPVLGMLTIVVGVVMLVLGLKLIEIFPILSGTSFTLPTSIGRFLGIKKHNEKEYSHLNSMLLGGMTFFLPCGFTQAMQIYALGTGSFISGALIMSVFAIGTVPGLLSIGGLTSIIKGRFSKMFFKFAGLVVIVLSIFNISNGFNLTGWTLDFGTPPSPPSIANQKNITVADGVQIIQMNQSSFGFSPNKFIVQKGLPVRWVIDAQDMSSCSSGISVTKLGITRNLILGKNIIEFTPLETGKIRFTCLMGMYPGEFTVVDDKNSGMEILSNY